MHRAENTKSLNLFQKRGNNREEVQKYITIGDQGIKHEGKNRKLKKHRQIDIGSNRSTCFEKM